MAGLILVDPALPTSRLGLVHPRVVANFLLCALPAVGEHYLTQRRRLTTAEQSVRRVLGVCCVDASRVPDRRRARPTSGSPPGWTGSGRMRPISGRPGPCPC